MTARSIHWWWAGLALIVLVAASLRLLSYDFSLPYIDHIDEPNYYLGALEWRGLMEESGYYTAFPPAYLAITVVIQSILELTGHDGMAQTIQVLRLLSVLADLLTIVLIAGTVRLVAAPAASMITGLSWALAPLVLENNVYARPDPLIAMLAALAIWLAANAMLFDHRGGWSVWSVVAGLVATLLKYTAFPLLLPGGLVALALAVRAPRRGIRYLVLQAGLVMVTVAWLFFGYGISVSNVEREGAVIRDSGLANMLNLSRLANNLYFTIFPFRAVVVMLIGAAGLAALLLARRRAAFDRPRLMLVAVLVSVLLVIPWVVASFAIVDANNRMRDVLPATVALAVLLGIAVDQVGRSLPQHWRAGAYIALVLVLTGIVYGPQLRQDINIVRQRRAPDLRVALRQWFDTNLDPGTVIVTEENEKTFNPLWGGIPYRNWVDWWDTDHIMEHPVNEWREDRGMSYAVIPLHQWQAMQETEAGRDYLSDMLHLRDFTSTSPVRGPEMIVYRLWRMAHETAVQFGDQITLTGYDMSADTVRPGDQIEIRLYWNASTTPDNNYSLFIHLVPADDYTVLAQFDGPPTVPERLTLTWDEPSETLISPPLPVEFPGDLPSGTYRFMIGLYNFETGVRLPVKDADGDAYWLTSVEVAG